MDLNFYRNRIDQAPYYGFQAGHEILSAVIRCSFYDSELTQDDFISIMNLCEIAHRSLMEENYNEGWNE